MYIFKIVQCDASTNGAKPMIDGFSSANCNKKKKMPDMTTIEQNECMRLDLKRRQ